MSDRLSRRLRTCVVCPSGVLGGAESYLLDIVDATDRLDLEILMLGDGPLRDQWEQRGLPVTVSPVGNRYRDLVTASLDTRRLLAHLDPDVVLSNGVKAQAVAGPAASALGVPNVWIKHDYSQDRVAPLLARLATAVVATAEEVGTAARRSDLVVIEPPRPATEPLPRPVALERLAGLGVPDAELLLVMLGRFTRYKGIDTAVRALAESGAERWSLLAVGGDEPGEPGERRRLGALAEDLGVSGRVTLLPHIAGAGSLLTAADAVAVLTRPEGARTPGREGFGISAMEAMLAGAPVIAIDDGGPVSRRVGGTAGVLVPNGSPREVAQALGRLGSPAQRRRLGATGRAGAERQPTADVCAASLVSLLARSAHRPGAGVRSGPPVSVVSPVLNEIAVIDQLVGAVVPQLQPGDEYILVDGGSSDGTAEAIDEWSGRVPLVRRVDAPGATIGRGRNIGVAAAVNDQIACTDAGCDVPAGWLAALRAAAAETDARSMQVGVFRAAVRPGRPMESAFAAANWPDPEELRRATPFRRVWARAFGRRFSPRRVDGRSLGFRKEAWTAAGGFPEQLRTAEDAAFGQAVLAHGGTSELSLDAEVVWHQRGSVAATFRQFRGYGHGGGADRSLRLLARDGARLAAYGGAVVSAMKGGGRGRALVLAGAAAYLGLPVQRLVRRREPLAAVPLVPAAFVVTDVAKVLGSIEALLARGRYLAPEGRR